MTEECCWIQINKMENPGNKEVIDALNIILEGNILTKEENAIFEQALKRIEESKNNDSGELSLFNFDINDNILSSRHA